MSTYGVPPSARDVGGMRAASLVNPLTYPGANTNQMSFPGLTPRPQVPPSYITGTNPGVPYAQPGQGSLNFNPGSMQRSRAFDATRAAAASSAAPTFMSRLLGGARAIANPAMAAAMLAPAAAAELQRLGAQPRGVHRPMRYLPQSAATGPAPYVPNLFGAPAYAPQQRANVLLPETQARLDAAYAVPVQRPHTATSARSAPQAVVPQYDPLEAQIMSAYQTSLPVYTPNSTVGDQEAYQAMQAAPLPASPVVVANPLAAQGDYAHGDMANGWRWNANTWSWEQP